MKKTQLLIGILLAVLAIGCATKPYDYTNFRKHYPKSILVLPPLNKSTDLKGTYSCLSSVTMPIAEMGYYVFPVVVVDEFLKENGMPGPGEMHQVSLKKISEIINPDAVMYIQIENYGTKYQVVQSNSHVSLTAKLVDTKTGTLLWSGAETVYKGSDSSGGLGGMLASALVSQIVESSTDYSHNLCRQANIGLFSNAQNGLLKGPYSPR